MKHLYLILCASALATTLTAQHLPENSHCRLDSALMAASNWGETDFQKRVLSYDAQDHLLGELVTNMHQDAQGGQSPWSPRMRTTYTNNEQGLPVVALNEDVDWETGAWTENGKNVYEYDAHGNCIKQEDYVHPWLEEGPSPDFVLQSRYLKKYDEKNRLIEVEGIYYYEGVVDYHYKTAYTYGTYGIEAETNSIEKDGAWKKSSVIEYTYNAKGNVELEASYDFDETGVKTCFCKREYKYDEQGHLSLMYFYYKQSYEPEIRLERTFYYTCNAKGFVVTEETIWAEETSPSQRIEYAYDDHDDLVNMKEYHTSFDPVTLETLPYLVLHEEETYYYKCLNGSSLKQLHATAKQQGCMMVGGKMIIVSGDQCFDMMGRLMK